MFKKERQREILRLVESRGKAEVDALAKHLRVSEMTIRRDLLELDEQGMLERVRGGALLQRDARDQGEPPISERTKQQTEIKRQIGVYVAGMIQDGEKIFVGSGSTTLAVAEALRHRHHLTVVTNALTIAEALFPSAKIDVTLTGGFLRRSESSLIGHFAEHTLHQLQVDKVIIGMRGIDPVKGLTSDNMDELMTDQAILNVSKDVIVVADHSKFGQVAAIRTAPVTAATTIVTERGGPRDVLEAIRKMGVRIIEVDQRATDATKRGGG
jgi:DeoR/GlpR family transcriptional regulator of sugar metabolism